MKKFKIYGFANNKPILITDSEIISPASTYNELFSEEEHMKTSLSFKIIETLPNGEFNPFLKYLYSAAKVRLIKYEKRAGQWEGKIYDHIITNVSSDFFQENIEYSISCEDYASVKFSKEASGLEMEFTGTIRDMVQELLVVSRKNMGYKDLNINHLKLKTYKEKDDSISIEGSTLIKTGSGSANIRFVRVQSFKSSDYKIEGKIFDAENESITIQFKQYNPNGIEISKKEEIIIGNGVFTIEDTIRTTCSSYELVVDSVNPLFVGDLSIKQKENSVLVEQALHIDPNNGIVDSDFLARDNSEHYYLKNTIELNGSNLYNGLVDIASLFNARIYFDYSADIIKLRFVNKKNNKFKGYRISPDFNINSITRDESTDEFITVLNIIGNEDAPSIIPNIPIEFKSFFAEQIEKDFEDFNFFGSGTNKDGETLRTYTDILNEDIAADYSRRRELENFAKIADLVPNLENTIYNIDYFRNIGILDQDTYEELMDIIQNKIRKINIKLRIYSELYYQTETLLKAQESEISFLSRNTTTERFLIQDWTMRQKELTEEEIYGTTWESLENRIIESKEKVFQNTIEMLDVLGLHYIEVPEEEIENYLEENPTSRQIFKDLNIVVTGIKVEEDILGSTIIQVNTYTHNVINIGGFYNIELNGLMDKVVEIENRITTEDNQLKEYRTRVQEINNIIDGETTNTYLQRTLEVEKAGLESRIRQSRFLIGEYNINSDPFMIDPEPEEVRGELQNILNLLYYIKEELYRYGFRNTLVDYYKWKTYNDPMTRELWDHTQSVDHITHLLGSGGFPDDMIELKANSSFYLMDLDDRVNTKLSEDKVYRLSFLLTSTGTVNQNFVAEIGQSNGARLTISKDALPNLYSSDSWLGVELYLKNYEDYTDKVYIFPQFENEPGIFTVSKGVSNTKTLSFKNTSTIGNTGTILIYRPRLEEVTFLTPTLDEMYALMDNPPTINLELYDRATLKYQEGLYDLLYNYNYKGNLNKLKHEHILEMYTKRGDVFMEGYYENNDEIEVEGLLEQALAAMETFKYPRIGYNTTIIDMSAIEGYEFLNLNIGDKILINEKKDRIYKSYDNDDDKFLEIESINYDLRSPENTTIAVKRDKEIEKILQSLISQI